MHFRLPNDLSTSHEFFCGLKDSAGDLPGTGDIGEDGFGLHLLDTDTNWFFLTNDGASQTRVDTGVAKSTDALFIRISWDSIGQVDFTLINDTFDTILAEASITTTLPGASQDLRFFNGRQNVSGAGGDRILHTFYAALITGESL